MGRILAGESVTDESSILKLAEPYLEYEQWKRFLI